MENLFAVTRRCIMLSDPGEKVAETHRIVRCWREGQLTVQSSEPPESIEAAGRPAAPLLVHPRKLPRRSFHTAEGRAALLHAITHIEFNAINLALDAVYRFRDLPDGYYNDWLTVADEEARHFVLLRGRLRQLGHEYGEFEAHNGLWDMAVRTAHDVLIRMALVPRVMEARGLDVTPGMIERFAAIGDQQSAGVLRVILEEEVGHVQIGSRWFHYFCDQRQLPREKTYLDLMQQYAQGRIKPPLHKDARKAAGFTEQELQYLEGLL
ncbi:MAG: ferritin-like domain-containing protein [Gammaproteobacteria bacterium]|nr:ferritin-like domain-containing protein [Gammaproteobacteria bacterium]